VCEIPTDTQVLSQAQTHTHTHTHTQTQENRWLILRHKPSIMNLLLSKLLSITISGLKAMEESGVRGMTILCTFCFPRVFLPSFLQIIISFFYERLTWPCFCTEFLFPHSCKKRNPPFFFFFFFNNVSCELHHQSSAICFIIPPVIIVTPESLLQCLIC